jgi:hypothetical protein
LEFASRQTGFSSSGRVGIVGSSSRKCPEAIATPVDKNRLALQTGHRILSRDLRLLFYDGLVFVGEANAYYLAYVRAREIIEEFRPGSIALPAVGLCRARRYHADHADVGAGLVEAA